MATPITDEKQKLKILVVDDEYDVAITLKTILEEENEESSSNNKFDSICRLKNYMTGFY